MIVMPLRHIKIAPKTVVLLIANLQVQIDAFKALKLQDKGKYRSIKVQEAQQVSGRFEPGMPKVRVLVHEHTESLSREQHQAIGFLMAQNALIEYFTLD
jgi:hypothetical protein